MIGIIALLIAMLLPALTKARHAGNVIRWKAYLQQLRGDSNVVAVYDFQFEGNDLPADINGNVNCPALTLENKAIGDPSDRLSTVPSNLNGKFAGLITGNAAQNPTWVKGRWNGKAALKFTGSKNTFVDLGKARDWNRISDGLTVAVWFKPLDTSKGTIVGRELNPTHTNPWYSWLLYDDTGAVVQLRTDSTVKDFNPLRVNDWNHLEFTYGRAGSSLNGYYNNMYQDDTNTGYTNANFTLRASDQTVRIGAGGGSAVPATAPPDPLTGIIDEVVIYKKVMPDSQVKPVQEEVDQLYSVGFAARD